MIELVDKAAFIEVIIEETVDLPIEIGDTILMGKFKNKKVVIKSIDYNEKGDLLVNINVWIPKNLTKDEQKIVEQLSSSDNFKPQPTADDKTFFDRIKNFFE